MTALVPLQHREGQIVPRRRATLAQAVEPFIAWLLDTLGLATHTATSYRYDLHSLLGYTTRRGLIYPDDVTFRDIEDYLAGLRRRGRKPQTVVRQHSCFKKFWFYLEREELATSNPAAKALRMREPSRKLPTPILGEACDRILFELGKDKSPAGQRDLALIGAGLLGGLRVSEATGLRCEDVNLEAGHFHVVHGKGDRERYVTIASKLMPLLRAYAEHGRPALASIPVRGYALFRVKGGPNWYGGYKLWRKQFRFSTGTADRAEAERIVEARLADLPSRAQRSEHFFIRNGTYLRSTLPLSREAVRDMIHTKVIPIVGRRVWFHLLRHSYATRLRMKGAPLELIQTQMGHAQLTTTLIYARITPEHEREQIAKYLD